MGVAPPHCRLHLLLLLLPPSHSCLPCIFTCSLAHLAIRLGRFPVRSTFLPGAHQVVRMHRPPCRLLQNHFDPRPRPAQPLLPSQCIQPFLAALPFADKAWPIDGSVQVELQEGGAWTTGRILLREQESKTAARPALFEFRSRPSTSLPCSP